MRPASRIASARNCPIIRLPPGFGNVISPPVGQEGRIPDGRRKGCGLARGLNPVAACSGVAFHQYVDRPSGGGSSIFQAFNHRRVVGDHRNPGGFGKGRQPGQLRLSDYVEGHQDVRNSGFSHDLCLTELLHGDPRRAQGQLMQRKRSNLVGLDVRSVRQPQQVASLLPAAKIGLDNYQG